MSFVKTSDYKQKGSSSKKPFYRRRRWKIALSLLGVFLIVGVSFAAYLYSTGSKIFENGLTGKSLIKTIYGKEELKGQNENRVNILIMGMGGPNHPGGMLADTIMVLSLQPKEKKVALISIPRDLMVPVPGHGEDKINSAFSSGYKDYKCPKNVKDCKKQQLASGSNLTSQVVTNILDIPIHYYAYVDFRSFEKMIDQLGGVDLYVAQSIYDPTFPDEAMKGYAPFSIKAGQHHLDGKTALKYARSRHSSSDFSRAARQQEVIMAAKEKALQIGFLANPKKVTDLISTIGDSAGTNFSPSELKAFIEMIKDIQSKDIISKVFSTGPEGELMDYNNGTYYQKPKAGNFKVIQSITKNIFSQTKTKEQENAKIEVLNGSKTAGLGGKVATQLEDAGLTVTSTQTAEQKYTETVIYDYSNGGKGATLQYLSDLYKVEVVKKTDPTKKVDISVIIGDDFNSSLLSKSNNISNR